jgi:hypothetical protein
MFDVMYIEHLQCTLSLSYVRDSDVLA